MPKCDVTDAFTIKSGGEPSLYFYSHLGIKEIHTGHIAVKKYFNLGHDYEKSHSWNRHYVDINQMLISTQCNLIFLHVLITPDEFDTLNLRYVHTFLHIFRL